MVLTWQEAGPGPIFGGGNVTVDGRAQVGAITSILPDPNNPNNLWVGTVNGGIWRSSNATAVNPTWTPVTDDSAPSLSVGALDLDPRSPQILAAGGTGNFSSYQDLGGVLTGVLLSNNGGNTWTVATDVNRTLQGKNITGILIRDGNIVVTASSNADNASGFFRSTDGGITFTAITSITSPRNLDPSQLQMTDILSDRRRNDGRPTENLFAAAKNGIFYSNNLGESWNDISQGILAIDPNAFQNASLVKITTGYYANQPAGRQTVLYVGIVSTVLNGENKSKNRLTAVYRTDNLGSTWTRMATPSTPETSSAEDTNQGSNNQNPGIHPGGQGNSHFSITIDPTNPNVLYVGGDRQPSQANGRIENGTNYTRATNWTGHLFRGDASQPLAQQWTPITNRFANGTAPHADSREMAFDAAGRLIQTDDGGIYRFDTANSRWSSMMGSNPNQFISGLRITEFTSTDWDSNSDLIIGGAQDNGVAIGRLSFANNTVAGLNWVEVMGGDGGMVKVDDVDPHTSYRYFSSQNLGNFSYQKVDAATQTVVERIYVPLNVQGSTQALQAYEASKSSTGQSDLPFITPIATNAVRSGSLLIGTEQSVYESTDRGNQLVDLFLTNPTDATSARRYTLAQGEEIQGLVYGGKADGVVQADVIYAGTTRGQLFQRQPGGELRLIRQFAGLEIRDIAVNPNNWREVYVLTANSVWRSTDAGLNWTNLTGNLLVGDNKLEPQTLRTIEYVGSENNQAIIVGGLGGVRSLINPANAAASPLSWRRFGDRLPNLNIMDLNYDIRDDVLVAATLGRGAWLATSVRAELGGTLTTAPALPLNPLVSNPAASVSNARSPEQVQTYLTDEFDDDEGELLEDGTFAPAMVFEISLNGRSTVPVTLRVATIDGEATAGEDYEAFDQEITFAPGETWKQIRINILNDELAESDESFSLVILDSQGAIIRDGIGLGTIETDPGEFAPDDLPTLPSPNWQFVGLTTGATPALPNSTLTSNNIIWRDYTTGDNVLWKMEDGEVASSVNLTSLRDPNWATVGTADFTKDGNPDILWYNTQTGFTQIWEMRGDRLVAVIPLASNASGWTVEGIADVTGDQSPDIIWRQISTGTVGYWEMDGTRLVSGTVIAPDVDRRWHIRDIADFTGDGKVDFLWQNDDGTAGFWEMNGSSIRRVSLLPPLTATQVIAGTADFDNDGSLDLLLHEYASGNTSIWYLNHGQYDEAIAFEQVSSPNWRLQVIADFDGDGQVDILWRDGVDGTNALWMLD